MPVTIQEIAERAGVSRGTVDRALNGRKGINPETEEKIKEIARNMGYRTNRAGRALALAARGKKIGVLVQAADTPFMKEVIRGVLDAEAEYGQYGITVDLQQIGNVDAKKAVSILDRFEKKGCDGIALVPADDALLRGKLNQLTEEKKIDIVTFNSDVEGVKRLCFVGQDSIQSGRTAAGLMAEILPERAVCLVLSGHPSNLSNEYRALGFQRELSGLREDIRILPVQYDYDSDRKAEEITSAILCDSAGLSGIYLAAAGAEGVCRALEKCGAVDRVKVISNDITPANMQALREKRLDFLIGQDAHAQGYESVRVLFEKLLDGKMPEQEKMYTEILIKTRYNV
jgi:LacI family transcriptional regulator